MKNCFVIFFGKIINTNRVILIEILRSMMERRIFLNHLPQIEQITQIFFNLKLFVLSKMSLQLFVIL
jgi:hypothetical protein